ncbi:MAG: hypothetical protein KDF60_08880 [Calditrichaeota bacterium]|nr:hypothetical protein [Calditrichota bacterium]
MKNVSNFRNKNALILASIFLGVLTACSGLDGNDVKSQYFKINYTYPDSVESYKIEDQSSFPRAVYYTPPIASFLVNADSLGFTSVGLFDFSGSVPFHIGTSFTGKSGGVYSWDSDSLESIFIFQKDQELDDLTFREISGYTAVTKYGAIGERVEGSIYGIVVSIVTGDTVQLAGEFSVIRGKDFTLGQP